MNASYLFRLDDITPEMDWGRFWALMRLFQRHSIKPLLGVVPDNRDTNLSRQASRADFWDIIRHFQNSDSADIAQHGYQHILVHRPGAAIIGPAYGIKKEVSEFAGDPFNDQIFRIREGLRILKSNGIETTTWMAPNHSYDRNTLKALKENSFTAVSDGVALFPYRENGLIFVPQASWRPRWMPLGVHTICIHTNSITPHEVKRLRVFMRRPLNFTRFSEVVSRYKQIQENVLTPNAFANSAYDFSYRSAWLVNKALERWRSSNPQHSQTGSRPWQAPPLPSRQDSSPQQRPAPLP
jgi:predicted deacetylase